MAKQTAQVYKEKRAVLNKKYLAANRPERNAASRTYYEKHKERLKAKARKYHAEHKTPKRQQAAWLRGLKSRFGINEADYMLMYTEQRGRCAICGKTEKKRLAVDHDHVTGEIRGLLCGSCNTKLGFYEMFKQSILTYLGA